MKVDIGIIGAMEPEVAALIAALDGRETFPINRINNAAACNRSHFFSNSNPASVPLNNPISYNS